MKAVAALAALSLATVGPSSVAALGGRERWLGAWSASPSGPSSTPLSNQTVRMIVAPHYGGELLRLRFSNRFGGTAIRLGRVVVARYDHGAAIAYGSERTVRFGGGSGVVIPAGRDVVSDRVRFRVRPFEKLTVSVFLAAPVAHPTEHLVSRQINYLSPAGSGDHSADMGGGAFAPTPPSMGFSTGWYFLDGVDVRAPRHAGAVVCLGDSITDGFAGKDVPLTENPLGTGANGRYPDDLARRLLAAHRPLAVLNAGISGNRVLRGSTFGPSALARLKQDVVDQPGVRDVIVLEGINDIGLPPHSTASEIISGLRRIVTRLRLAGLHVLLGTLTPTGGARIPSYSNVAALAKRRRINGWIRSQRLATIVDFDKAVRDPRHPSRIYPLYDSSDHIHFSLAGYRALAAAIKLTDLMP